MAPSPARQLLRQHPLQRLTSPSRGASALLHSLGLASFAYSFAYLVRNPNPVNDSYGWHMQYLTILGLSLAAATFAVGLLADVSLNHALFEVKNALSVASAPMEVLISLLYWGLRAVRGLAEGARDTADRPPDRSEARLARLGPSSPLLRRPLLPRGALHHPRPRSPFLLPALHHRFPSRFGAEWLHCFWLLVLD